MPANPSDQTIDQDTPTEALHHMIQTAERTSDKNIVRRAAQARAELGRREQKQRMDELLVQITAQQKMIESLIQSSRSISEQQAVDAREQAVKQLRISRAAAFAACGSAIAAFLTLVFNVLVY